ncbi:MAG TPA: hypothetical protein VL371_23880, partial [Gemmataceae bacterium]|nr:hypothetical protein [Gemmataceae bacterium]
KTRVAAKLVFALLLLFVAEPASGQQRGAVTGEGTDAFRLMLKMAGLKPVTSLEEVLDHPTNSILMVLGSTEMLDPLAANGELKRFLNAGGALLVATDRRTSNELFFVLPARVSGEPISVPRGPSYRELPDCPLVVEPALLGQFLGLKPHQILSGLDATRPVATNRPSCIEQLLPPMGLIAELDAPGRRYAIFDRRLEVPNRVMFAAVGEFKRGGRAAVLADHSVFINSMMWQTDNDNIRFAYNITRWLADDGKRTNVLLCYDGDIQRSFDVDLTYARPPFPPIEALVPLANQMIGEMEQENLFNRMLVDAAGGPDRILRGILLLFTLGMIARAGYRFLNSKFRSELRPAKVAPAAAPVPDVERRHQAILTRGNFVESAHELAHQTFVALGAKSEKDELTGWWWDRAASGKVSLLRVGPYRVFVLGSWWQREVRLRRVSRLWRTATGRVRYVSARRLRRIVQSLHDLHDAVADGKIHLVTIHRPRRPGGALTR